MIFDSDGLKQLIPDNFFDVSVTEPNLQKQIEVPSGYELMGLVSEIDDIMSKHMKFVFIDRNNVACRAPSNVLRGKLRAVFHVYSNYDEAVIEPSEIKEIFSKLSINYIDPYLLFSEAINYDSFQNFMV